ncbi:MAG: S1 RNA-binding domain-containing protein [Patescibacteria group bacterium]|nr:S1 RNA-binding domain-containing protein [Patescibacteria group bacterium]MDD4610942.1 S1 RNA-binding domain-containing protein [Patescibacteria group bacterium]
MSEEKTPQNVANDDFGKLLDKEIINIPQVGDTVKGIVVSASKAEVKLDINGILIGVVRGPELYEESDEYASLKPGEEVEATVIDTENEKGELELSFRYAGQEKSWANLREAFSGKTTIKVKIVDANKGGLLANYRQISGFLPVSQLAPENYPRVTGGDKSKILEKLNSFAGKEFEVRVITLDEKEGKIIFSEKDVWSEKQQDVISKYKAGTVVEGTITAVTDFGVFVSFGDKLEGLIHISELAWQRIDDPADLFKVGDKIKAEIINVDGSKIFLSAKKLITDPWADVDKKFKTGQIVKGEILKVNPFGLFVKLDDDIHGLAHVSQLGLASDQKAEESFKAGEKIDFEIMSIEAKSHRLGLKVVKGGSKVESSAKKEKLKKEKTAKAETKSEEAENKKEDVTETKKKPGRPKKIKE